MSWEALRALTLLHGSRCTVLTKHLFDDDIERWILPNLGIRIEYILACLAINHVCTLHRYRRVIDSPLFVLPYVTVTVGRKWFILDHLGPFPLLWSFKRLAYLPLATTRPRIWNSRKGSLVTMSIYYKVVFYEDPFLHHRYLRKKFLFSLQMPSGIIQLLDRVILPGIYTHRTLAKESRMWCVQGHCSYVFKG